MIRRKIKKKIAEGRMLYVTPYFKYEADWGGPINNEYLHLRCNGHDAVQIHDHGNGIHVEGDRMSVDLNYSQAADLYYALRAHNERPGDRPAIFSDCPEPIHVDLTRTKTRKTSKKGRKK